MSPVMETPSNDSLHHPPAKEQSSEANIVSDAAEDAGNKGNNDELALNTQRNSSALPEAENPIYPPYYYYGIASQAPCLASSNPAKVIPGGPPCHLRFPNSAHPIKDQWHTVVPTFVEILNLHKVKWTSIDLVCIDRSADGDDPKSPPVAWIGAQGATDARAAHEAVWACAVFLAL